MLTKTQKIKIAKDLGEVLKSNANFIFVDFAGLTMAELTALKRELKKKGMGFKVIKKSLLTFAFKSSGIVPFNLNDHKGSLAIVYGSTGSTSSPQTPLTTGSPAEPDAMAKIVHTFSSKNKNKKPNILGGFLMGEQMIKDRVVMLAQLPSREVLLAQILQLLLSPMSGLAMVLDGVSKKEKVAV